MAFDSDNDSPPDIETCGICVAPLRNTVDYCSLITPENSNGENVDCKPMSVPSVLTSIFQFPFNQPTGRSLVLPHKMETWLLKQDPFLTCGSCSKNVRDLYSSFLLLRNVIHEASKLSDMLQEWTEMVVSRIKDVVNFEDAENVQFSLKTKRKDGIEEENSVSVRDISEGDHSCDPEASEDEDDDDTPISRRRTSPRIQQAKIKLEVTPLSDEDFESVLHDDNDSDSENETKSMIQKTKKKETDASQSPSSNPQCLCTICQQTFPSVKILAKHIKTDHNVETDNDGPVDPSVKSFFGCGQCPKAFVKKHSLQKHLYCHLPARLPCSECGKVFKKLDHLKRHLQRVHGRKRTIEKRGRKRKEVGIKENSEVIPSSDHEDFENIEHDESDSDSEDEVESFIRRTRRTTNAPPFGTVCSSDTASVAASQKNNRAEAEDDNWTPPSPDFPEDDTDSDEDYNPSRDRRTLNRTQKAKALKTISPSTTENANVENDSDEESNAESVNRNKGTSHKYRRQSSTTSEPQCLCTVCQQTFSSVKILVWHLNSEHGASIPETRPYPSQEVQTARVEGPENHSFTTSLGCAHCSKTFFKPNTLRKHLYCHLTATMPCPECGRLFKKSDHLKRHLQMIHGRERIVGKKVAGMKPVGRRCVCSECGKSMWRSNLAFHMKIHRGDRPFKCEICGKGFPTQGSLKEHMKSHNTDRPFCCSVCGNRYKQSYQLKEHEQTHQENVPKPYVCSFPDCGKSFLRKRNLKNHEVAHRPARDHACHICGATFKYRGILARHIETVHMKKRSPDDTKTRVKKEKVAESYICPECGIVFKRKDNLRGHIRRLHERNLGENSCQCETCGKTFRSQTFLRRHMAVHQMDRPFCCSVCGSAFKHVSNLRDHEKVHNRTAEKPFVCTFPNCSWAFSENKGLQKHLRNHTATKDHACHICGTAFKRKSNLHQHIVNVHGKPADGRQEVTEKA